MERNREARRASVLVSNGFNRRRHRTNSPDEDVGVELQESVIRLRDRVKKDRDRDLRERSSRSSKRRRAERLMNSREDNLGDETSEESLNDDDEDEENDAVSMSNQQFSNHHNNNNHHLQHRKTFPPSSSSSSKFFRAAPVWRPGDEIISVSVPRKARSANTKRSHDWNSKKLQLGGNNGGPKVKPSKVSLKKSSSNPEELEIEIAEVLFGLKTHSQVPSSKKEDSKLRFSSPISNSTPLECIAPKKKRAKSEISAPNLEKISGSAAENVFETGGNMVNSQGPPVEPPPPPEPAAQVAEELMERRDLVAEEEILSSPKGKESPAMRTEDSNCVDSTSIATATMIKANSLMCEVENQREEKLEIDLMALPLQVRSSPRRETKMDLKPEVAKDKEDKKATTEESEGKVTVEEAESKKEIENKERSIQSQLVLGKPERDRNKGINAAGKKMQGQQEMPLKATREEPLTEKSGQSKNPLPSPMPMASWPGGLPPMGYMAPMQGVVSMDGTNVAPPPTPSPFTQPRPKRCATHCYIARNIHCLQQFMKMNPFWPGSASLFGSKPGNLNAVRGLNNAQDKGQSLAITPNPGGKDKGGPNGSSSDSAQKKQQILIQQALPCVPPNNLLGPAFIFPVNHHQAAAAAASARSSAAKSPPSACGPASSNTSAGAGASASTPTSFKYPNMSPNETQYLAVLQNNGYPFPIGALPNYRATPTPAMPLFNSSFNPAHMIHPSHLHHHQSPSSQNVNISSNSSSSQKPQQNFAIHPQNHGNGNQSEKQPQQPLTNSFAMSFGPINGANITSMAQNHAIFQSLPEATRQNIQMMMAAHQKKNFVMSEDDKSRNGDSSVTDDERKKLAAKGSGVGQSVAHVSSIQANSEIESSARSLNVGSGPARNSQPVTNVHHIQGQLQQQMAVNRSNGPVTSNRSLYTENLNSSSTMASKFPNALSGFRQNIVPSSLASSTSTTLKNLPEHHPRNPTQMHTQISFGGNQKSSAASQGQATPSSNRVPSPPMMVGPPTTSSISKETNGSPKRPTSTNNIGQASSLSGPQPKNSPSILGNPNVSSSYSNGAKPQMQLPKNMQQAQLFFSNPYSQAQSPHSYSTSSPSSGPNGYFMQRRRPDQPPATNTGTNDPAKAIAAATNNVKGGGGQSSQAGIIHAAQFANAAQSGGTLLPAGFSYVHPVQVKPAEQKQPAA